MKKAFLLLAMVVFCGVGFAQMKDEPKTLTQILDGGVKTIEGELIPAAEAMPEEKYGFVPTNGTFQGARTFAQQVKHVAAVNYIVGAAILGEKPPIELGGENGPDSIKTKADIVKFAKDSYAYAHKAVASVNAGNATEQIKSPFGDSKVTRMGMATVFAWHGFDHYGQMAVYLRMNGIVPPASRGRN